MFEHNTINVNGFKFIKQLLILNKKKSFKKTTTLGFDINLVAPLNEVYILHIIISVPADCH